MDCHEKNGREPCFMTQAEKHHYISAHLCTTFYSTPFLELTDLENKNRALQLNLNFR